MTNRAYRIAVVLIGLAGLIVAITKLWIGGYALKERTPRVAARGVTR